MLVLAYIALAVVGSGYILVSMLLGHLFFPTNEIFVLYPIGLGAIAMLASIVGVFGVRLGGNNNMKDLSALNGTNYVGAVNENFFEWFGLLTMPNYSSMPANRPYDPFGQTLVWFPIGVGAPPQSSNAYIML